MVGVYTGTDKGNANLTIQDGTNSTSVYAYGVNTIQVSSGTLTNDGNGKVSITTGGGGGGGTISGTIISPQVAYGTANDEIGGDGNFTWDSSNELLTASYGKIKNIYEVYADVNITKGQAVYITGYDSGSGKPQVALAKANSSTTMPSIGLATANITAGQQGFVIFSGQINGVNTAGTTANDTLYVSRTTAGALTTTKPTGATEEIQNVGRVVQVGASGKIAVSNIGRTNDVPNTISITGDITSTTGNISATTGTISGNTISGTTFSGSVVSMTGDITSSGGNLEATAGDISAPTGTISGSTMQVGAGELQLTVQTLNAVIENTTQDNDILFRINDGGTTANIMTIDASESRVIIDGEGQVKKANVITLGATPISYATHAGAYLSVSLDPIQLPAISSVGEQYVLVNNSGGPLTLSPTGADTIVGSTTLSNQSAMTVFALTSSDWFVIG
jgi:hypothetical protein